MLPVPTLTDLASFSGRLETTYGTYAAQALQQATLMFSVESGLEVWPDDPELTQVGINAILEMADRLVLQQPYQAVQSSPYQSETIGSYNYSKGSTTNTKNTNGVAANLFWWTTALDLLGQKKVLLTASGSIAVHIDGLTRSPDGLRIENPDEQHGPDRPPYIRIS